jgi:protein SCO1
VVRAILRGFGWLICASAAYACSGAGSAPNFTLRDDHGASWSLAQQRGKAVLLTFGFTHCADTCPATVAKLVRVTASLPTGSREAEVAFVTIDPARDTVAVLHRYVERFALPGAGQLVGLTGTTAQIERVKRAYGVWSQRLPHDIAHTAVIVVIDPSGRIRSVENDDDPESALARVVAGILPS